MSKNHFGQGDLKCLQTYPTELYIPIYQYNIFVPPRYVLSSHRDSANYFSATLISHNHLSPVSHPTTTNNVDTGRNNYDDTHSFSAPRKHNHRTPDISETTTTNTPVRPNVHSRLCQMSSSTSTTTFKLPPYVKKYLCFWIDGKYSHAAQCDKSRALTKVIYSIPYIEPFKPKFVIMKILLHSDRL